MKDHGGKGLIDLSGKTALITGANKGIGWAIARLFAARGARLAINYPDKANRPADLAALGGEVLTIQADVGKMREVESMFGEIRASFRHLDILVNNAGIFPRAGILDLSEQLWDRVLDVNLKGTFFCAQQAAKLMIERNAGRIINIASVSAFIGSPVGAHYHASKAGVVSVTKSLALALAPYHIAVNAIAPGLVNTDQPRDGFSEAQIEQIGRETPWRRIAQPDDVARAALYLASEMSEYVTGHTLLVSGGSLMMP
jgi:3-oxoacyl-[acyl-carrier protein] reductase